MEKKILGIIIICIFLLIIYKKESFISTGIDKILIDNQSKKKTKEKIIETVDNARISSDPKDDTYTRILWIFAGVIIFVFLVINYKFVPSWLKSMYNYIIDLPRKIKDGSNNNSDDIYDELNSFGGKKYYMGGYDINDYSE